MSPHYRREAPPFLIFLVEALPPFPRTRLNYPAASRFMVPLPLSSLESDDSLFSCWCFLSRDSFFPSTPHDSHTFPNTSRSCLCGLFLVRFASPNVSSAYLPLKTFLFFLVPRVFPCPAMRNEVCSLFSFPSRCHAPLNRTHPNCGSIFSSFLPFSLRTASM